MANYTTLPLSPDERMVSIISVEGNIGSGKSTLLAQMQTRFSGNKEWLFLQEPVHLWNEIKDAAGETILSKFYADPAKYAFAFQIMAYTTRLHLLRNLIKENPQCKLIICERSLEADKHIFAKMLHDDGSIEDVNYQIYSQFFSEYTEAFSLNAVIYVNADAEVCHKRVQKRSRTGESNISLDYLQKCREYHEVWLNTETKPILNINANIDVNYVDDQGTKWLDDVEAFLRR